jgi:DNA polymerase-3 subunit alpha
VTARIAELGHTRFAVTDHGNVYAHVPIQKAARDAGLTPIYGVEFYICDDMRARVKGAPGAGASSYPHVTVLAATQAGYENLLALHNLSYSEGFYYKPRIDWPTLFCHQDGLVVLSGCVGGYPSRIALGEGGTDVVRDWLRWAAERIEHFWVELVPQPGLDLSHRAVPALAAAAAELGLCTVATADAHFPRPEDWEAEDFLLAVGTGDRVDAAKRKLQLPRYQYYCNEAELLARGVAVAPGVDWATAIAASDEIAAACGGVEIPRVGGVSFAGLAPGEDAPSVLWRDVVAGAAARGVGTDPIYRARAEREYRVLREKGFCDYLLAVADVVRWVRDRGGLVVLRGSAGGCLLLWLLGASVTDPVRHGLSFERFYDDSRHDPPDVDIDFEQSARDSAVEYVYDRYGRDHCSQIAALSQLKAKAALQDTARALGVPRAEFAALAAALDPGDMDVERQLSHVTDSGALEVLRRHPRLRMFERLIGQYRQSSTHACGVLVSPEPLRRTIGVVLDKDRRPVAAVDKKGAAALGFLKMDFLSVRGLDVVAATVRRIGRPMSWLEDLPLDDKAALNVAQRGLLAGVFQLDGAAAARTSAAIGVDSFGDVYAAGALCRPGPADWVDTYRANKADPKSFHRWLTTIHPAAAAVVEATHGVLIYQEQVMRLAHELAGLDWPDVHALRKGIQVKAGLDPQTGPAWEAEWAGRFIDGCVANGVSAPGEAEFWWSSIKTHGGYSFNKSHCVTYGLVGYWMLYLKAHHPAEFYEAYLGTGPPDDTVKKLVREFQAMGGEVRVLDPEHSRGGFRSPEPWTLVGGYSNLKGVGPAMSARVAIHAPYRSWDDLLCALGGAPASRLAEAGAGTDNWDPQALAQLAPWYPVDRTGPEEAAIRDAWGLARIADLPPTPSQGDDAVIGGYVTWEKREGDRLLFILEDEGGAVSMRVPYRLVAEVGAKFRALALSDYVAARGWWAGDVLYAKDVVVVKRREGAGRPPGRRRAIAATANPLPPLPTEEEAQEICCRRV